MALFKRKSREATVPADEPDAEAARPEETEPANEPASAPEPDPAYDRSEGPYDVSERPGLEGLLDLGSIRLAGVPGMEINLAMDPATQQVSSVNCTIGDSTLQVQAFAAPRTQGIWSEVRTELAAGITRQGGTAEQAVGPMGPELRAQLPVRGPNGRTGYNATRFVGVDGPRWFLRGALNGRAAVDAAAAEALLAVLRASVVVRGEEAMAPRDLLPLSLPPEAMDAPEDTPEDTAQPAEPGDPDAPDAAPRPSADDLRPFERGPEITEVR